MAAAATKRVYELVAAALKPVVEPVKSRTGDSETFRARYAGLFDAATALGRAFKVDNPNFKPELFMRAAGFDS